jgi:hypothetical protein
MPSCSPAVPPPPVCGAAVGKAGVCDAGGVVGRIVVTDGLADGDAGAEAEPDGWAAAAAAAEAEAEADDGTCEEAGADACEEAGVRGEPDAETPPGCVAGAVLPDERAGCPVGDGVRVPDGEPLVDALVCGVGVKVDGAELPLVQAETAIATRTAPAAERPTVSHAPRASPGTARNIFMNPPRMRVR